MTSLCTATETASKDSGTGHNQLKIGYTPNELRYPAAKPDNFAPTPTILAAISANLFVFRKSLVCLCYGSGCIYGDDHGMAGTTVADSRNERFGGSRHCRSADRARTPISMDVCPVGS
ncbi:hypothetical protein [Nocardia arthritidis]|uniref:hypothetical protein n=1 Tax=Nocardia arthritidis TaxID=228602 RepID=UPI001EEA47E6|nr:hypothetical protein [Nocardia arthritidis]